MKRRGAGLMVAAVVAGSVVGAIVPWGALRPVSLQAQSAGDRMPRTRDGKPDLSGVWGGAYNPISGGGTRRCGPTQSKVNCNIPMDNFWVDYEWLSPWRFGLMGHPIYKPEHWDKIQELDQGTNKYDPVMT